MITILVQVQTKPSEHERFMAAARTLRDATVQEEGNVEYALWSPDGGGSQVLVLERWRDKAALDAHHEVAHMAQFRAAVKGAVAAPPTSDRWESEG
jgi:quinol monooxygenase YgiN